MTALTLRIVSFTVKSRQNDIKDILNNVDVEGSTLLHLAVDSGSTEVSPSLATKLMAFGPPNKARRVKRGDVFILSQA